ncbi:tail fiber domain-containing protein [Akkermansiaceae bacterium]|nr:tail fiber domain-containing protein [Akkermansiaceae bacterium]
MLYIKSNHVSADPTIIIEGGGGSDDATIQLKNADVNWSLSNQGGGYSDSFLIRDTSTALYPFAIDPTAGGTGTAPLLYMKGDKISILRGISPAANLHVSGNIVADGPNGSISASGLLFASASEGNFSDIVVQDKTNGRFYTTSSAALSTTLPSGILSSSTQIATDISGALSVTSLNGLGLTLLSSSTQIATDISGALSISSLNGLGLTLLSSSTQIATDISGSWQGQNFISSSGEIAADISGSWQGQNFISASQTFLSTGQRNGDSAITGSLEVIGGNLTLGEDGDGHVFKAHGNSSGKNISFNDNSSDMLKLTDNTKLGIGIHGSTTTADLEISHDGTDTIIENKTGNLLISASSNERIEFIGNITASGNISASGLLFASSSEGNFSDVVVQDLTTGRFYTTSSAALTTTLPSGILSSSTQIATEISGAIDAATGSLLNTYTFLSSSTQIAADISGSWQGQNFISASQTFLSTGQRNGDSGITGSFEVTSDITSSKLLIQKSTGQGTPTPGSSDVAIFQNNDNSEFASIAIIAADDRASQIHFGKHDDIDIGSIKYFHDGHSSNDQMKFKISGSNVITFNNVSNRGSIGVGADFTPTDYFHAQGTLSGGGLTVSSSNGGTILLKAANTRAILDRTATDKKLNIEFNTAGTTNWTLGNIAESDDNFYIYNGDSTGDKHISLTPTSTFFHTDVTASNNISASNTLYINKIHGQGNDAGNRINIETDNRIDLVPNNIVAVRLTDTLVTLNKDTFVDGHIHSYHITASGNISASGTLNAGLTNTNNTNAVFYDSTTGELTYATTSSLLTGLLSSSTQIATDISGAIDAATGSLLNNHTFLSSSTQIAADISGSWQGQNFISSSGEIAADISGSWQGQNFVSASQTFLSTGQRNGDSAITGSLEVVGNISASGHITASSFKATGNGANLELYGSSDHQNITGSTKILFTSPRFEFGNNNISNGGQTSFMFINGDLRTKSHLTASGNITASGTLKAGLTNANNTNAVFYDSTTGELTYDIAGNIGGGILSSSTQISSDISGSWQGQNFISSSGEIAADISGSWQGQNFVSASQTFLSTGQRNGDSAITGALEVTNEISASGGIYLPQMTPIIFDSPDTFIRANAGGNESLQIFADVDIILKPDNDIEIHEDSTLWAIFKGAERELAVHGSIHASGSGIGHITASGNISASGTGIFSQVLVDQIDINGNTISSVDDSDVFLGLNETGISFDANSGDKFIFNAVQNPVDFHFVGENDQNLFYISASVDKVGIGTSTPAEKLTVHGNISASGLLFASSSEGNYSNVVVQDLTNGRFYTTSSAGLSVGLDTFKTTGQRSGSSGITGSLYITGPSNTMLSAVNISSSNFLYAKDLVVAQSSIFGNDITLTEGNVQWLNSGNDQSIMQNFAGGVTFGEPDYPVTFNSNVTASLNMSASGLLFASASEGNFSDIVVQDKTNGRFYTTSSAGLSVGLDTFKTTGQRNGDSSITGSLTVSGSTEIKTTVGGGTTPQLLVEFMTSSATPAAGALIELKTNIDYRARGIHMTHNDGTEEWFSGISYTGGAFQIGFDPSAGQPWRPQSASLTITEAGNTTLGGILAIPGFSNVSASLAAGGAGDNLGNHIATQDINMNSNSIISANNISASGDMIASGNIIATGNISASGDFVTKGNIYGDDGTDIFNINQIYCDQVLHDGDTDNGFVFGSDLLTYKNAGVEALVVGKTSTDTYGLMGLGKSGVGGFAANTAPYNTLHIKIQPNGTTNTHVPFDSGILITRHDGSTGTDDLLGSIAFDSEDPYYQNNTNHKAAAGMFAFAAETHDGTSNHGAYLTFRTKTNGTDDTANSTEKVRITDGGAVGIGTTSPSHKLTVEGSISSSNHMYSSGSVVLTKVRLNVDGTDVDDDGGSTAEFEFNSGQKINIVTTPGDSQLDFNFAPGGATAGVHFNTNGGFNSMNNPTSNFTFNASNSNVLRVSGDIVAFASDKRLKENIVEIPNSIEKIKQLRGVTYDWKDEALDLGFTTERQHDEIGLIAQELEKVIPQAVTRAPFDNTDNEKIYVSGSRIDGETDPYKTVKMDKVVPLLIEGIKEQQKQIDELKELVTKLTNK